MKEVQMFNRVRRAIVVAAVSLMACALLVVAHVGQAQSQDGRSRRTAAAPQQTPKPVPTPTPKPGLVRPGQVILTEAPPEMPNPTSAEMGENETLKINTDLVNLNVRVIDRNNHPIGDIRQDEIHVFENGVPQPIFSFTKEEVPISYGLAIDTSG